MIADRDVQTNAASLNFRAKIHVVQMKLKLKKKWIVTTTNMKVFCNESLEETQTIIR